MKIDLSREEFRTLFDLVCLGDWVLHAYQVEPDPRTDKHREMVQKILSLADDFGCGELVESDEEEGLFYESREHEEGEKFRQIDEFEENTFWETLISRLAERDFFREVDADRLEGMSLEEKFSLMSRQEGKWAKAFEEDGFDRLELKEDPSP